MSRWWLVLGAAPITYFLLASRNPGFKAQPGLAGARTATRFTELVDAAGGRPAIVRGIVIDVGFVVVFAVVGAFLLAAFGGPWWLALVPAALDLTQDLLIVLAMDEARGSSRLTALPTVTYAMYAAYLVAVVAVVVVAARSHR